MAASGFENTFVFLTQSAENAAVGIISSSEDDKVYRPFTLPAGGEVKSFTEEDLVTLFDRADLEEQYAEAVASAETTNMHADMMVPSIKSDYAAGVHRDVFLRHTSRITRIIAESSRRMNHAENVHPKRQEGMGKFEAIKPYSSENEGS